MKSGSFANIISGYSSVKNILIFLGLVMVFNGLLFPTFYTFRPDARPPDILFFDNPETVYSILGNYSAQERTDYLTGVILLDFIYPVVYSLLFSFVLFRLWNRVAPARLPLLILLADYAENFGIILLLLAYPRQLIALAWLTLFFTTIKWILVVVVLLVVTAGLGRKIFKRQ
ncbi:MAG: hypothetical protein Kow00127_24500 [Bacteroidales bacterium]